MRTRSLLAGVAATVFAIPLRADFPGKASFALTGLSCPYQLAFGDFNGDGRPDLAVSSWHRLPVAGEKYDTDKHKVLLFFQKNGVFAGPPDRELKLPSPWGLAAGDFDGDGKTDLAVKESRRLMHVFTGADDFREAYTSTNGNDSQNTISAVRLSRGGLADFLCGPVWRKWLGGESFTAGYCYGPQQNDNGRAIVVDLDQDANADILFLGGGKVRLYYGPFPTQTVRADEVSQFVEIRLPSPPSDAVVGDLNGDGRPDIAAALRGRDPASRAVVIYHQNAPVGFRPDASPSVRLRGIGGRLAVTDLNGDGLQDLTVSDGRKRRINVFMQRKEVGLGPNADAAYQVLAVSNYHLITSDINGDGFPDLAVSDGHSAIRFFLNDGKDDPGRRPATPRRGPTVETGRTGAAPPPVAEERAPAPTQVAAEATPEAAPPPQPAAIVVDLPPARPGPDYGDPYRMPFYTGTILPTPQEVAYRDELFPLDSAALLVAPDVAPDGAHVRELRGRVERYGGKLEVVTSASTEHETLVILGGGEASEPFLAGRAVPDREQAYVMLCVARETRNVVVLQGRDLLGLAWAIASFNQLVHEHEGRPVLRAADVTDYPEHANRGFIAGHWVNAGHYCAAFKINKPVLQGGLVDYSLPNRSDRAEAWRSPLSNAVKRDLAAYGERMSPLGIEWYAGHNPIAAKDKIRSGDEDDFRVVLGWASAVAEAGGNLCLKYDDHRFPIGQHDLDTFGSAREADIHLLTRLHRELKARHPQAKILFCPPFYWGPDSPAMYPEPRDEYLRALGERVPRDVEIFWTGPRVKSGKVTPEMVEWITDRLQRKPVYWQNGFGMPHMFLYHYVTDPVDVYREWFYEGFFRDVDSYMFNCMMPAYASAAATCADFCWNPSAYDPDRSVADAAAKLVGPDTYPVLIALTQALTYFDPFGLRRTPGAARKLPEMGRKLAVVNAVWEEVNRRNINAVRTWTGMERHVSQVNTFYERLSRAPDLAAYRRDATESEEHARKETGLTAENGLFLSAYDFVGGYGPTHYGNRCERRLATWIYGSRSPNPRMEGTFRTDPFPPSSDYELIVSAQDDDAEAKCRVRISVNGVAVFEGENPFVRFGWSRHTFRIPAASLERTNVLRIANAEDTGRSGGPPFFMLNYAVVRKAE